MTEVDAEPATEPEVATAEGQHVVLLSGLSGGGKTAAAKLFEDLGYTVVDNLPGELLTELAELVSDEPERFGRVAIVLDVRSGDAPMAFGAMRGALEGRGIRPRSSSPARPTRSSRTPTRTPSSWATRSRASTSSS